MQIASKIILLPFGHVLLPGMVMRMRTDAMNALPPLTDEERAFLQQRFDIGDRNIVSILPRDLQKEPSDVATLAIIMENTNGVVVVKGLARVTVDEIRPKTSTGAVTVVDINNNIPQESIDALKQALTLLLRPLGPTGSIVARRFSSFTEGLWSQNALIDLIATMIPLKTRDKLDILNEFDTSKRAQLLIELIKEQTQKLVAFKPSQSNQQQQQQQIQQKQRLIKSAQRASAGGPRSGGEEDDELAELEEALKKAPLPADGRRIVDRELRKIKRTSPQQAEYNVMRSYLETIADIPWDSNKTPVLSDSLIKETEESLNADHYGLDKVKKRLLEYLAVLYLQQKKETSKNTKTPILCLVGPPGVGKTSLAQSVAKALGRPLHRISLGGVRDEAEIRGHRRTYIGAMPGVLVQGLRKARSMSAVFVLDEIDKVGQGVHSTHGDPSAALLEVLDPEQNSTFTDHYIGFPVDLSGVLFIATANSLEHMSRPLLDRMEVISIEGYTYLEKQHIAQNYLLPKQIQLNALDPGELVAPNAVIDYIATRYTRESGVRNLERLLGTLCRGRAVELLAGKSVDRELKVSDLQKYLGLETFHDDVVNDEVDIVYQEGKPVVREAYGLVNGLAYMGSGTGGILVFEASLIAAGAGRLKLTGKLGDVISESAQIAMSWVRAHVNELGIETDLSKSDIHLHAPAGAIPKDGPSAGVAMTVCLVSLLCRLQVPRDIAMTGEITLRGKILPVGGVREKLLGAHMAGVRLVLLPYHCRPVVEDECQFVKELDLEIVYVKYIWDAFACIWPGFDQREVASL